VGGAVSAFLSANAPAIVRVRALEARAAAGATPSALAVITARLRGLRPSPTPG
jgi:hypothetical protein